MKSKNKPNPKQQKQEPQVEEREEEEEMESEISSQDDDGALLTDKVEEKLLSTLAKIKLRHPSIYQKSAEQLFQDEDFQGEQIKQKQKEGAKFTYKQMVQEAQAQSEQEQKQPIAVEQRKAKQQFKKALKNNIKKMEDGNDDLFQVVGKIGKKEEAVVQTQKDKFKELTGKFNKDSKKLIKKVWKSDDLDQTDLFLKNYILDKKWMSSKHKMGQSEQQQMIDQEDEERSQEMDQYEADYNFRFEEPGGTSIVQYPRSVSNSLRQKPETRKQKRKKTMEKKKQEQLQLRKQAELKKQALKKDILQKIVPQDQEEDHDWFFCDDCCKGLVEKEVVWSCLECDDYMLCQECYELIIHKHPLEKSKVPKGFGAPSKCQSVLQGLKSCITCRRRIPTSKDRFEYTDRSYIVNSMCERCYDQSNLEIKKKYKKVQAEQPNFAEILDQNPEKIKELTNQKEIQEMVDQYIRNDFEGVLSGGLKTKFKYISVPAQSYGLSDEQILFGDDKELNKYVSVKKLAPYNEEKMRLKNSLFNKKIKSIKRSVKSNKQLLKKGVNQLNRKRLIQKMKSRASAIRQRTQKKLRIVNLSNREKERNHFVSSSRLMSYGIKGEQEK